MLNTKINLPPDMDVFKVMEDLCDIPNINEWENWVKELIWRNEQGCSQAMRND